jgi:hypothetical protein
VILSQVIANYRKKVKQPSHSEINKDHIILSSSLALSSSSYPLISLFEGVAQKCLEKKEFSWLSKSKFPFLRNSHPLWAMFSQWVSNPPIFGFKPPSPIRKIFSLIFGMCRSQHAALALTFVAQPVHPPLTLHSLTLLLRQIHKMMKMMKRVKKEVKTMNETS